jgi:hypothetical protein
MSAEQVSEDQIIEELHDLEPSRWGEVLDFIGYLKTTAQHRDAAARVLTAHELLRSSLTGLWADRDDIEDSLSFAHRLRHQAERRQGTDHDPA